MSQSETSKVVAAGERTDEARSFVGTARAAFALDIDTGQFYQGRVGRWKE